MALLNTYLVRQTDANIFVRKGKNFRYNANATEAGRNSGACLHQTHLSEEFVIYLLLYKSN